MLIEGNPLITLKQAKEEVTEIFPTKSLFSIPTLSRYLDGELISLKMSREAPERRNSPAVKDSRHAYTTWMLQRSLQQQIVYIDETGVYCNHLVT